MYKSVLGKINKLPKKKQTTLVEFQLYAGMIG